MSDNGRGAGWAAELHPAGTEGFDFAQWRRLTERALAESERRLAETREAVRRSREAVASREHEVRALKRALEGIPDGLAPAPTRQGTRTGQGPGGRAAAYLLEVARARPDKQLTPKLAQLACRGWAEGTVHDGLERLVAEGLAEHPERGVYRLTPQGLAAAPAATGTLGLLKPVGEE